MQPIKLKMPESYDYYVTITCKSDKKNPLKQRMVMSFYNKQYSKDLKTKLLAREVAEIETQEIMTNEELAKHIIENTLKDNDPKIIHNIYMANLQRMFVREEKQ